jgi:hypothetical protein
MKSSIGNASGAVRGLTGKRVLSATILSLFSISFDF